MVETTGQPEPGEEDNHLSVRDGTWLLDPVQAAAYREALRAGVKHVAALVVAQDPLYWGFVHVVAPEHYQAAANQKDLSVPRIIERLVRAQGYKLDDIFRPEVVEAHMPAVFSHSEDQRQARRQEGYATPDKPLEPWLVGLSHEELVDAGIERPKRSFRERHGIKTEGRPDRPSRRPGANWARIKRKRALARQAAEREGLE
jgi:hypothetical protein